MSPSPTVSAAETSRSSASSSSSPSKRLICLPSMDSAARNAVDVRGLRSLASTLSVASSACLTAKPSPTSASTTGPRTAWPLAADGDPAPRHGTDLVAQFEHHPLGAALADAGHPGQRGHVAVGQRLTQRRRVVDRQRGQRDLGSDTGHRQQRENRSRASESAKPYNVIESSRTIIAMTSRASVPRRSVASVDGRRH